MSPAKDLLKMRGEITIEVAMLRSDLKQGRDESCLLSAEDPDKCGSRINFNNSIDLSVGSAIWN